MKIDLIFSFVIDYAVNIIMLYSLFSYILYFRMKPPQYVVGLTAFFEVFLICLYKMGGYNILFMFITLIMPVISNIFLVDKTSKKLLSVITYCIGGIVIIGSIEAIFKYLVNALFSLTDIVVSANVIAIVGELSTFILWIYICHRIHGYYVNAQNTVSPKFFAFLAFSIFMNMAIYSFIVDWIISKGYKKLGYNKIIVGSALVLCGAALLFEWVYVLFLYFERTRLNITTQMLQSYMKIEHRHFDEIKAKDENLRKFRHDIKGHIEIIKHYFDIDEVENAKKYLAQLDNEFSNARLLYNTGNPVVDSILSMKHNLIVENNIEISLNGNFRLLNNIDDFAICTIFQNAVQNAIEACEKIEPDNKRFVEITCNNVNDDLFVQFTNPVFKPVNIKNNAITTTKKDYVNHGFGLKQIEKVTEDIRGNLFISCNDLKFSLKILLS